MQKNGILRNEFPRLFSSLFKHSENYVKIIKALGKKNKGLTRDEIIRITKIADGGRLSTMLEELELCGFIRIDDSSTYKAWCGFSFEKLCMAHLPQIRRKLGIFGVLSFTSSWRYFNEDGGAQIDLLIDRKDNVINVCEMKYAQKEYQITKRNDESFRNKIALFQEDTKTRKTIHFTLISAFGAKHNEYWGDIQSEVTMDDLFEFN